MPEIFNDNGWFRSFLSQILPKRYDRFEKIATFRVCSAHYYVRGQSSASDVVHFVVTYDALDPQTRN